MTTGLANPDMWGPIDPKKPTGVTIIQKQLTLRKNADPTVYRRYKFIPAGTKLSDDDMIEILLRKNGKRSEYGHKGSFPSVGGHTVKYEKGDRIETTLEHCIENINLGRSSYKWMNAISIESLAKEANIHPEVLIDIILTKYNGTRIYKLIMGIK